MVQFIVNNLEDSGKGSLRQAIENANTRSGKDEIVFEENPSGGEIVLTSGQLNITDSLQITGLGADRLALSGNNTNRVFTINDGSDELITVEIIGLKITEGFSSFRGTGDGAGIRNFENLTVRDSIISDNFAQEGGAGISNQGILDLLNSAVINNTIAGGIIELGGGGIYNNATASIINSTIAFNEGNDLGGGIANRGDLEIVNSTITGNTLADSDNTSNRNGAGIYSYIGNSDRAITTVTSSIVAGNSNDNDLGGGLTIDSDASFNSGGNNLIGNGDGATGFSDGVNGDIVGTAANAIDPLLGTLQDNGGGIPTTALLTGSPAIDAGSNPLSLNTDQRGANFSRTLNGDGDGTAVTDIGAFEADSVNNASHNEEDELIFGVEWSDSLKGGTGNDTLNGLQGTDTLDGGTGDDILVGDSGHDLIFGGDGHDLIAGNEDADILEGGNGSDTLFGDEEGDILVGGNGHDILIGGSGADKFTIVSGRDTDGIIDFNPGEDVLRLSEGLRFESLNLQQNSSDTDLIVTDTHELIAVLIDTDINSISESDFVLA